MLPISDSLHPSRFPYMNFFLVIVTVFVFIQEIISPDPSRFIMHYSLIPDRVSVANLSTFAPFVTAIFLHDGFLHIASNMWFLWVFGDMVEVSLAPPLFLLLYLVSGVSGNVLQYLLMPHSNIPMIGASGAIAGVLGCYFVLFSNSKVKTFIFILFFVTFLELRAPLVLGYWFFLQLFSGITSFPLSNSQGGIAFFAHIAGFIVGVLFGLIYKKRHSFLNNFPPFFNQQLTHNI